MTVWKKEVIRTQKSHPPHATYSQAVKAGNLFFAGVGPFDKEGKTVPGDLKTHTRTCMENLKALLIEAGTTLENLVAVTVYLKNYEKYYYEFDEAYREYIKEDPPARVVVQPAELPWGALVLLSVTAIIPEKQRVCVHQ
jgi:2-iminobutanoate/2-iminopropanoate deaminase